MQEGHKQQEEKEIIEICVNGVLSEYRVHLENLGDIKLTHESSKDISFSETPHYWKTKEWDTAYNVRRIVSHNLSKANRMGSDLERNFLLNDLSFAMTLNLKILDRWIEDNIFKPYPFVKKPHKRIEQYVTA